MDHPFQHSLMKISANATQKETPWASGILAAIWASLMAALAIATTVMAPATHALNFISGMRSVSAILPLIVCAVAIGITCITSGALDASPSLGEHHALWRSAKDELQGEVMAAGVGSTTTSQHRRSPLYLDSGATIHLDPICEGLTDYKRVAGIKVTTAQSGAGLAVRGLGDRKQGAVNLRRVHHAPGASKRLASLGQILDDHEGWEVQLTADGFQVRSTPCTCDSQVEALGYREVKPNGHRGMYAFVQPGDVAALADWEEDANTSAKPMPNSTPAFEGATTQTNVKQHIQTQPTLIIKPTKAIRDLHASLGHANLKAMQRMAKSGMLPLPKKTQTHLAMTTSMDCTHCEVGKACRKPSDFRKPWNPIETEPGAKLMCDLRIGFATEARNTGHKHFLDIIDSASHFVAVIGVTKKNEAQQALKDYIVFCENQYKTKVRVVQSDNDGSIVDGELLEWLESKGVRYVPSAPYDKELNGAPERDHRTLNDAIATLLHQSGFPPSYWELALHCFNFVKNRTHHALLPPETNPCTVIRKQRVKHQPFVPFGCKASAKVHPDTRLKDDSKVEEDMIMVGYAPKGCYKLLRSNGNIVNRSFSASSFKVDVFPYADESFWERHLEESDDNGETEQKASDRDEGGAPKQPAPARRSTRVRSKPILMSDMHIPSSRQEEERYLQAFRDEEEVNAVSAMATGSEIHEQCAAALSACAADSTCTREPTTFTEAISCPDKNHWIKAIGEELQSHLENNTWTKCPKPSGQKVIGCKWVFKIKRDQDGRPVRYKARLTAKGYSQTRGIDFDETFAPTVRFTTIRLFFALCASFGWTMRQLDVKTAYLIPELKETIFMRVPEGLDHIGAVRLNKSLYGLKQAGREWNHNLHKTLVGADLKQSAYDPCLYERFDKAGNLVALLVVYVDDILIGGKSETVKGIALQLTSVYKMTQGPVEHFLGMKVRTTAQGTIEITQGAYTRRLLERFRMDQSAAAPTPAAEERLSTKDQPSTEEERAKMSGVPYRECVGALQYLAVLTRPDIVYAVNQASRFLANPGPKHWEAVKRILRYLRGTPDDGIIYTRSPSTNLVDGFSDSDWAGDQDDRRSCSGHIFRVFGGIVAFRSKKQPTTALSSCEAELIALTMAMKEALWLRGLLVELGMQPADKPVLIHEDNQGAIALSNDAKFSNRTKHVDIKFFRVREEVKRNFVQVKYCHTSKMLADIFTKPLAKNIFRAIRNQLGMSFGKTSAEEQGYHPRAN
jgi:hypothetical protein